jgi:hypothetical protein
MIDAGSDGVADLTIRRDGATLATRLVILALLAAGFALTMVALYPGYMTTDAGYVYAPPDDLGDWQSPLMTLLWWAIDPLAPGPACMFLLIAALYWVGFGTFAFAAARRCTGIGIAVPLLALTPPAVMMLGMLWRDMLFGVTWLLAAAITFAFADASRRRWPAQTLALALIGFGVLLRPTAFVAAPLLAAYALWPSAFRWKRAIVALVPMVAVGYLLIPLVYYGLLDVARQNPLHSLLVFDLGGITHFTGENQFPVTWSEPENALLTTSCYNPERWDYYWTIAPCDFVMQRLERKDDVIFGTPRLTAAWRTAVLAHPLAYLQHRFSYFRTFLADPNTLTLELYRADDPSHTPLANNRYFKAMTHLHEVLKTTLLFRPWFWLAFAAAAFALALPRRMTAPGAFAIGTAGSGILFVMSYLPFGVAADFRYGWWCVLAGLVSAAALPLARKTSGSNAGSL